MAVCKMVLEGLYLGFSCIHILRTETVEPFFDVLYDTYASDFLDSNERSILDVMLAYKRRNVPLSMSLDIFINQTTHIREQFIERVSNEIRSHRDDKGWTLTPFSKSDKRHNDMLMDDYLQKTYLDCR